jgi:heat shock protein HslJ
MSTRVASLRVVAIGSQVLRITGRRWQGAIRRLPERTFLMLKLALFLSCSCVLIDATSVSTVAAQSVPNELVGTWLAEDIGGGGVIDYLQTTLEINDDGTYSGFAGCNNYTGTFDLKGGEILFGPAGATRKMCVPAVMDQETKFFAALKAGLSWKIEQTKLVLDQSRFEGGPAACPAHGDVRRSHQHSRRPDSRPAGRALRLRRPIRRCRIYQCRTGLAGDARHRQRVRGRLKRHSRDPAPNMPAGNMSGGRRATRRR